MRPPPSSQGIPFALVPSQAQSGIKCGVGSQRKFAIFLAHSAESSFSRQKCRILTFRDKKCRILAFRDKTVLALVHFMVLGSRAPWAPNTIKICWAAGGFAGFITVLKFHFSIAITSHFYLIFTSQSQFPVISISLSFLEKSDREKNSPFFLRKNSEI